MKTTRFTCIKFLMLLALVNICVSSDFDFFYFVQQWPGSYCDTKRKLLLSSNRKTGIQFQHSNFNNGSYPSNCDKTQNRFKPSKITDLIPRAQRNWASLSCAGGKKTKNSSSDNTKFWKHEWDKHGTCSGSLEVHEYFEVALNLKDRINLLHILENNGIKPNGEFYSVANITQAIKQATGFGAGITCNTDPSGNKQLNEIYLCVDKSASNFIECPILPKGIRSCTETVEFPIF